MWSAAVRLKKKTELFVSIMHVRNCFFSWERAYLNFVSYSSSSSLTALAETLPCIRARCYQSLQTCNPDAIMMTAQTTN